jgi:F-type H+-transporting ATPase subunit delta
MSAHKKTQQLARQLFKLSFVDGRLSQEQVGGVLEYVEKTAPAHPLAVLKVYQRLVATEVARNQAVIEHAGDVSPQTLQGIASALSRKYNRPVSAVARANPGLLAGLRVRVGDDVYENSVSGQLSQLGQSV